MNNDNMDNNLRETLWKRIQEIRDSWKNTKNLEECLNRWEEDYGTSQNELAMEIIAQKTEEGWRKWAQKNNLSTLEDFIHSAWEGWTEGEYTIERKPNYAQIYCTKCPMADAYLSIGKAELGKVFHCCEDPFMVLGFNPQLKFGRTKTLMDGNGFCNHYYTNNPNEKPKYLL
ncbi:MAG: L-2-amino-thiazoline-4-carboxylic acid hydrolase [Candidatus Hodarchaeales archaeon]